MDLGIVLGWEFWEGVGLGLELEIKYLRGAVAQTMLLRLVAFKIKLHTQCLHGEVDFFW